MMSIVIADFWKRCTVARMIYLRSRAGNFHQANPSCHRVLGHILSDSGEKEVDRWKVHLPISDSTPCPRGESGQPPMTRLRSPRAEIQSGDFDDTECESGCIYRTNDCNPSFEISPTVCRVSCPLEHRLPQAMHSCCIPLFQ
jgi:hypothetical protein